MTDYFIIPDTCRGIAGRAQETMLDRDLHFPKLRDALTGALDACGSGRMVQGGSRVVGAFRDLDVIAESVYEDKLAPVHQDVCGHIDSCIGAFSEVISSYVSGDVEQRIRAESAENRDVELAIPQVRNSDGTVIFEGGSVGTEPNTGPQGRSPVNAGDSPGLSPFSHHPDYRDDTP